MWDIEKNTSANAVRSKCFATLRIGVEEQHHGLSMLLAALNDEVAHAFPRHQSW